jgi:hypothetical protein
MSTVLTTGAAVIGQVLAVILCGIDFVVIIPAITLNLSCQIDLRLDSGEEK